MNYNDAYPPVLSICPPQVLISDHSAAVPLVVGSPSVPLAIGVGSPSVIPSFVPLMASSIGAALPGTTPPSVLPPSPPVLSGPLPHVFVSDHSEIPRVVELTPKIPPISTETVVPVSQGPEGDDSETPPRRSSEPAALPSVADKLTEELAVKPKRHQFRRYTSVTPRATSWGKRIVVFVIVVFVGGLAVKIGSELWQASYGGNSSSTVV